jgi:hypothetical protein
MGMINILAKVENKVLRQTYFTLLYLLTDQNFGFASHLTKERNA